MQPLDNAINQMAERNGESVMLTDGELFTQTATKNNPNNPYMHAAFKKWLLKGHDIHIIAEPYQEVYKGQTFNKNAFTSSLPMTELKAIFIAE